MQLNVFTDGGARGNPGNAGIGVIIYDEAGQVIYEHSEFIGVATNNEAEYKAFIAALKWLNENGREYSGFSVSCKLDSKLVVEQVNKRWKIKEPRLKQLAVEAWGLMTVLPFPNVTVIHIGRSDNAEADALVNQAIDAYEL